MMLFTAAYTGGEIKLKADKLKKSLILELDVEF